MRKKRLFELAVEMMEATNPYKKPLDSFCYTYIDARKSCHESLLEDLEKKAKDVLEENSGVVRKQDNYMNGYEVIKRAIEEYFVEYRPQSYAFLQATQLKFAKWLKDIAETYHISDAVIPEKIKVKIQEQDTAVTMLKALHSRKGVKAKDLEEMMGITQRAVQKNLKKLDPTWNADFESEKDSPFRIGGQTITVKLDVKQSGRAMLYRTKNTVHPLVLLENQMQVGVLLKSLAHSYYEEMSGVCYTIALDIWYQLSDYSKERVNKYFALEDENLRDFIEELEDAIPAAMGEQFQTERSMLEMVGTGTMSQEEILTYVLKGHGRRCDIVIRNAEGERLELIGYKLETYLDEADAVIYVATGSNGEKIKFRKNELEEINI